MEPRMTTFSFTEGLYGEAYPGLTNVLGATKLTAAPTVGEIVGTLEVIQCQSMTTA